MSTTPQQQDDASAVWRLVMEELRANQAGTSVPIEAFSEETRLGAGGLGISSLLLLRIFVNLKSPSCLRSRTPPSQTQSSTPSATSYRSSAKPSAVIARLPNRARSDEGAPVR
jgi:hypothetical protein